jgi:spore coat polysaccharide biosynthesis protein SpsF
MNVKVILQARMSSSRLPGKVVLPVSGIPMAVLCALRIARDGLDVVLATSDQSSDDILVNLAMQHEVGVIRGDLADVLSRFNFAITELDDEDIVVRVTADNPFVDADFVKTLVKMFQQLDVDYMGTSSPIDGLPYGMSAEVMTAAALRLAHNKASTDYQREHVTPWIRENLKTSLVDGFELTEGRDLSFLRCTVDNFDDYISVSGIFHESRLDAINCSWRQLIDQMTKTAEMPRFRVPCRVNEGVAESVLTLGTAQLGLEYGITNRSGMPDQEQAGKLVRLAVEYGVNWIDTARGYGVAEQRLGQALSNGWGARVRVVTKLDPMPDLDSGMSSSCIKAMVEKSVFQSMHAMKVDRLDVLLLHRWAHRDFADNAIWDALIELREQGLINELGASIYSPDEAIAAMADDDIKHLQLPFNLLDHRWLEEGFQKLRRQRQDIRIHARSIFLQGLLLNDAPSWPSWCETADEIVGRIQSVKATLQRESRADLCVAYVLGQSWIDSIVLGMETVDQLMKNLELVSRKALTSDECNVVVKQLAGTPERLLNPSQW